jgi:hypothetical protein
MASENAVAIRVRITRGIGTPQLLGRLDSTPGQAARQSRNLLHYVGLVPPIAVGFAGQSKGCLTIFDPDFRTGLARKARNGGSSLRILKGGEQGANSAVLIEPDG